MKKILSALLAVSMVVSLAACGEKSATTPLTQSSDPSSTQAADPILTGEKPVLKILSMYQAYNYEEQPSYKLLEELTGYKTKWFALPAENADQKLLLEMSSGADYDLLLRMSPNGYAQLSSQGALIDLTPIIDKYGANIKNVISDFAWQSTTDANGTVNAIPHEDMVASKEEAYGMLTGGIGVRSDAMEAMGVKELPTNLDDFTQFLKDAKAKFGKTPLTANKASGFTPAILAAFGIGDAEWIDINGTYTHRIKNPAIVDYLAYMQMLYKEKLLDNDMPINTGDNAKEKFASNSAIAIAPLMFWDIPSMVNALKTSNPDAKAMFITDLAKDANTKPIHYIGKGAKFVSCISQNAKNPEHAINWLNILTETDNYRKVYIGEEGVSYEIKDGGYHPIFTGDETKNFSVYTNSDKFTGFQDPVEAFKMWQARARKTPEMAAAYEQMNSRTAEYDVRYTIEAYGKTAPAVQKNAAALALAFSDAFLKAIVDGTDPAKAIAAMQAQWDKNGGLEMEKSMNEFYAKNKQYAQ
ncbi:MAG: extracellular solute-binding protein [Oscillospiraceae bacterium]